MATILPFVIRPRAPAPMRRAAGSAAIVIFPGVRYEPAAAPVADAAPKTQRAVARKRKTETN